MTDLRRMALAILMLAGCAAPLTGCSSNSNQGPSLMPAARTFHARSWINKADPATVFVASAADSSVYGFSQQTGYMTEQIANLPGPNELATDAKGNLYVSLPLDWSVLVYPPGSTTPRLTLTGAGPHASGLAVSAKGEVAVVSATGPAASVVFFAKGKRKPFSTIALPYKIYPNFAAYDRQGNLWTDSEYNGNVTMAEIVGGGHGRQISTFVLSPAIGEAGGIEIDKSGNLLVNAYASGADVIFQYQLPNPSTPIATISLPDYSYPGAIALTSTNTSIYAVIAEHSPSVMRVAYPGGGSATQLISVNSPAGIAVTPWSKP